MQPYFLLALALSTHAIKSYLLAIVRQRKPWSRIGT